MTIPNDIAPEDVLKAEVEWADRLEDERKEELTMIKPLIRSHEVELTQYLPPHGHKKKVYAPVGEEYVKRAKEKEMRFSCEVLSTGQVAIYGKLKGWSEEEELVGLAGNKAGEDNPTEVLRGLIDKLDEKED